MTIMHASSATSELLEDFYDLPERWQAPEVEVELVRVAAVTERRQAVHQALVVANDALTGADPLDVDAQVAAQTRVSALDVIASRLPSDEPVRAVFEPTIALAASELSQIRAGVTIPTPAYLREVVDFRSHGLPRDTAPPVLTDRDQEFSDVFNRLLTECRPWGAGVARLLADSSTIPPLQWLATAASYLRQAEGHREPVQRFCVAVSAHNEERRARGLVWRPADRVLERPAPVVVPVYMPTQFGEM